MQKDIESREERLKGKAKNKVNVKQLSNKTAKSLKIQENLKSD